MLTAVQSKTARFGDNEQGSVAMMFGLAFLAVSFCAGMGIDMARYNNAATRVAAAADAAALTAGRALLDGQLGDSAVEDMGEKMFWADIKARGGGFATINSAKVTVDRANGGITVAVDAFVPTTLTALAGIKKINIPVVNAATFQTKDIEVGMALDITGSMGSVPSGGGKPKIDALKDAFETFANKLIPANPVAGQKVRIGLAPYSAAINVGAFAGQVTGNRSTDGCVLERTSIDKYTDAPAAPTSLYKVKADGVADIDTTEGTNANAYGCPSAKLVPLSDDRDMLINKVKAFKEGGWTAGHLGVQWGWNLVSEGWAGTWGGSSAPDAYSQVANGKLIKAVILMTDGIFNTAYHNGKSADQALQLCTNMKAKGVLVFAVAFDAPAGAQATLKACASSPTDFYADASNDAELEAAFNKFAGKLGELHLSK